MCRPVRGRTLRDSVAQLPIAVVCRPPRGAPQLGFHGVHTAPTRLHTAPDTQALTALLADAPSGVRDNAAHLAAIDAEVRRLKCVLALDASGATIARENGDAALLARRRAVVAGSDLPPAHTHPDTQPHPPAATAPPEPAPDTEDQPHTEPEPDPQPRQEPQPGREDVRPLPCFWLRVLWQTGLFLTYDPTPDDIVCLSYLVDVAERTLPVTAARGVLTRGVEYRFAFAPNPYFADAELAVRLVWRETADGAVVGAGRVVCGAAPAWRPGRSLSAASERSLFNVFEADRLYPDDFCVLEAALRGVGSRVIE